MDARNAELIAIGHRQPECFEVSLVGHRAPQSVGLDLQVFRLSSARRIAGKPQVRETELGDLNRQPGRPPAQGVLGQVADVTGKDATPPKGVDQGLPVRPRIIGDQLAVGGDQRAQIVTELQIDRRTVVDRADA